VRSGGGLEKNADPNVWCGVFKEKKATNQLSPGAGRLKGGFPPFNSARADRNRETGIGKDTGRSKGQMNKTGVRGESKSRGEESRGRRYGASRPQNTWAGSACQQKTIPS